MKRRGLGPTEVLNVFIIGEGRARSHIADSHAIPVEHAGNGHEGMRAPHHCHDDLQLIVLFSDDEDSAVHQDGPIFSQTEASNDPSIVDQMPVHVGHAFDEELGDLVRSSKITIAFFSKDEHSPDLNDAKIQCQTEARDDFTVANQVPLKGGDTFDDKLRVLVGHGKVF